MEQEKGGRTSSRAIICERRCASDAQTEAYPTWMWGEQHKLVPRQEEQGPRQEVPPANATKLELKLLQDRTVSIEFSLLCPTLCI